jgi:hypothetical protein
MPTPKVDAYSFGQITIDGQSYHKDLIIFPDGVKPNWWRKQGHNLSIEDLGDVLSNPPRILVIGTGAHGDMHVPNQTHFQLEEQNIQVIIQESKQACHTYNQLRDQGGVVLAIHLTC